MFTLSTVSDRNSPGNRIRPGSMRKYMRPSDMMLPQDAISGGTPAPKLRMASVSMAEANT